MNTVRVLYFSLLILVQTKAHNETAQCLSNNVTVFYWHTSDTVASWNYINGKYRADKAYHLELNTTKIRAIAYDYANDAVLFVDHFNPNAIWAIHLLRIHRIVYDAKVSFDDIAVDPVTNNIYFTDGVRGVGVCGAQSLPTPCKLLIHNRKTFVFHDLVLFWQRGVMFWIEKAEREPSQVKMASMNGQNVRILEHFETAHSIALDSQYGNLYVSLHDGTVNKYSIQDESIKIQQMSASGELLFRACKIAGFGRIHTDDTPAHNANFTNNITVSVMESDLAPKFNPCNDFKCDGLCVISSNNMEPIPDCILFENGMGSGRNVTGFFIAMAMLFFIVLVCVLVLTFNSKLRLEFRYRIMYFTGFKLFVNQANDA